MTDFSAAFAVMKNSLSFEAQGTESLQSSWVFLVAVSAHCLVASLSPQDYFGPGTNFFFASLVNTVVAAFGGVILTAAIFPPELAPVPLPLRSDTVIMIFLAAFTAVRTFPRVRMFLKANRLATVTLLFCEEIWRCNVVSGFTLKAAESKALDGSGIGAICAGILVGSGGLIMSRGIGPALASGAGFSVPFKIKVNAAVAIATYLVCFPGNPIFPQENGVPLLHLDAVQVLSVVVSSIVTLLIIFDFETLAKTAQEEEDIERLLAETADSEYNGDDTDAVYTADEALEAAAELIASVIRSADSDDSEDEEESESEEEESEEEKPAPAKRSTRRGGNAAAATAVAAAAARPKRKSAAEQAAESEDDSVASPKRRRTTRRRR